MLLFKCVVLFQEYLLRIRRSTICIYASFGPLVAEQALLTQDEKKI
jgi:hypothetical protein